MNYRSLGSRIFDTFNILTLILITLTCLLPFWYCLMISLSEKAAVQAGIVFFRPVGFNLYSYKAIIADEYFFTAFLISIKRVVFSSAITMFVLVLTAYPLSKTNKQFPGRNLVMWVFIFCMLFTGGLIPWFLTIKSYGLLDNIWGLVLCGGVPIYNLVLMINFTRNLPEEIEEAAIIDGAGSWRILFSIILPLLKPVLATILLFTIVGHWNDFFQGFVLSTQNKNYPLQTYIQQMVVVASNMQVISSLSIEELTRLSMMNNNSLNAAKIFIAMIPILIIYPFLQKYFVTGITLGSVKG